MGNEHHQIRGTSFRGPDALIAEIASRQYGTVRLAQLLWAGLDHNAITRRVRDGRLHRLYRGVYAVGFTELSENGKRLAAVFAYGDPAALGLWHCASLHDVSRWPSPARIDIVVPTRRRPIDGLRVHHRHGLDPRDVTTYKRIPVTRIERMLLDFADVLTPHQLAFVIHRCAFHGLFFLPRLQDVAERSNGRRLNVVDRAIELHLSGSVGTRSTAEDTFLRVLDGRVEEPLVNAPLLGEEPDFHWPARRLVVEVDGPSHGRPASRRDDARKDAKLREAGWTVLRCSDREVHAGAPRVMAALEG